VRREKVRKELKEKYEQQGVAMTCRSFEEYLDMFMLNEEELQKGAILDVASGASSFTKGANDNGYIAFAVDPLFDNNLVTLEQRGIKEIEESTQKIADVSHLFHWDYYGSLDNHCESRKKSISNFVTDFKENKGNGRYIAGMLPKLPCQDNTFSLILCSHFLFLYESQFDFDFHYTSIKELMRICRKEGEIRIYPIVGLDGHPYKGMEILQRKLEQDGVIVEYIETNFRFFKGATHILRLRLK
jgi:hypothetical protein